MQRVFLNTVYRKKTWDFASIFLVRYINRWVAYTAERTVILVVICDDSGDCNYIISMLKAF